MGSLLTSDKLKFTVPSLPRVRRRIVKSEDEMCLSDEDDANNKRKCDDFNSCDMTLKELKERSKKKKKLRESAGFTVPSFCNDTNQDDASAIVKIEEPDIEIPLSAWKRKVLNKAKQNGSRKKLCSSLDSEASVETVTDPIHSSSKDSSPSVKINPPNTDSEVSKPECSDFQIVACGISDGYALEALAGEMDNSASSSSFKGSLSCVVSEAPFDYLDCEPISYCFSDTTSFRGTTDPGSPQLVNQSPHFSVCELSKVQDFATNASHSFEKPNAVTQDLGSDIVSCKGYTIRLQTSCKTDSNVANQLPHMVIHDSLLSKDLSCGGNSCDTDVKSEDISSTLNCNIIESSESMHISSMDLSPSPDPPTDAQIASNGSPLAEIPSACAIDGSQSTGADGEVESLPMISPTASHELTVTDVFKSQHVVQGDSVPRKLFSTRKAISPTSQEKLRHAMNIEELNDSIGNPKSSPEGSRVSSGKAHGRSKKNCNVSPQSVPKGILKASPISAVPPHDSSESSHIPSRAQKAVAFSQRQMLDIESLAGKLVKELKSMKDIIEESLSSNEFSSTPPKYTADEIRNALQNVVEVEETTKRWLSMMAKDCNRFCKIMRSTGKTSSANPERKKIIFADEAGGLLCHVKILEDSPDSETIPESEGAQ